MNVNIKATTIIGLVVALLLLGILLPIGLADLTAYNGSYTDSSGAIIGYSTTMATLVGTVLPVMGVISIVLMLINANRG